jgi:hypothetical protein
VGTVRVVSFGHPDYYRHDRAKTKLDCRKENDHMGKKPAVVTGPHPGGGWQNKVEGNKRASNVAPTKAQAQVRGREMAQNLHTEHKIQNRKGQIAERNSYGNDPFPPKG